METAEQEDFAPERLPCLCLFRQRKRFSAFKHMGLAWVWYVDWSAWTCSERIIIVCYLQRLMKIYHNQHNFVSTFSIHSLAREVMANVVWRKKTRFTFEYLRRWCLSLFTFATCLGAELRSRVNKSGKKVQVLSQVSLYVSTRKKMDTWVSWNEQ